jgi:hypothetical protein
VLFLSANPSGTPELDLSGEIKSVRASIRSEEFADRLNLISEDQVTLDTLSKALHKYEPHVVHFSGHGDQGGDVILNSLEESSDRDFESSSPQSLVTCQPVRPRGSAKEFGEFNRERSGHGCPDLVQMLVLNCCYSEYLAGELVKQNGVDCAVGTHGPISDTQSIEFSSAFYQALAFGQSVGRALIHAQIRLEELGVSQPEKLVKSFKKDGVYLSSRYLLDGPSTRLLPMSSEPPRDDFLDGVSGEWTGEYHVMIDERDKICYFAQVSMIAKDGEIKGSWTSTLAEDHSPYKAGKQWSFNIHGRFYRNFLRLEYEARATIETRFGSILLRLNASGDQLKGKGVGFLATSEQFVTGSMTLRRTDPES